MHSKKICTLLSIMLILVLGVYLIGKMNQTNNTKSEYIENNQTKALTLIYKNVIKIEVTNHERISRFKEELYKLPKKEINKEEVIIEFVYNGHRYFLLEEDKYEFINLYSWATIEFEEINRCEIKKEEIKVWDNKVFFVDHDKWYKLPEKIVENLVKELKESRTLYEHLYIFTHYPGVRIEILEDLLYLDYVNDEFAYVILDGLILTAIHLPKKETWEYISEEYSKYFIRENFMLAKKITITLDQDMPQSIEGTHVIDSFLRILLPIGEVKEKPKDIENYDKIIIEVDLEGKNNEVIEIYKNDFWYYNGDYYYKKDLFEHFRGRMVAG